MASLAHVTAERAGDRGQDHVVDGAAQLVLDLLHVRERGAHPGKAPVRAVVVIEGAPGSRDSRPGECPGGHDRLRRLAQRTPGTAHDAADSTGDLAWIDRSLQQGLREQLGATRLWLGNPALEWLRLVGGLLLDVEEDRGYVNSGNAVDHRVVRLSDDGKAPALQPLDQPELPQRLRAVELLGEDPGGQHPQL